MSKEDDEELEPIQHDPTYNLPHEEPIPELDLWRAVLIQALLDVTNYDVTRGELVEAREAAYRWIVASIGVTCEDFEDVCELAGVSPDEFRKKALCLISQNTRYILRDS